jgi:N6-L-threonylcarbamoyladenine synthase
MLILAVETSCDETAIAILKFNKRGKFEVLANQISSQIKIHAEWGGIVPNLAAREHSKNLLPVIKKTLKEANLELGNIDLFAVTQGPGLIPALLLGTNVTKTLAYFYQKPLIGIHHIEGHIYSNFIKKNKGFLRKLGTTSLSKVQGKTEQHSEVYSRINGARSARLARGLPRRRSFDPPSFHYGEARKEICQNCSSFEFPILNLVISGGHTQLILMKNHLEYEIIGETQDDAVGEAFDKVAKLLGFEYPGGPIISKEANDAEELMKNKSADKKYLDIKFPRPMLNSGDLNFSFSGLKTAVLYFYQNKLKEETSLAKMKISDLSKFRPSSAELERGEGKTEQHKEVYSGINGVRSARLARGLPRRRGFDKEICQICNFQMDVWKKFISKAFQEAVVDVLKNKTLKAIEIHQPKTVLLSGGVSANSKILETLEDELKIKHPKIAFHSPEKSLCGDNAVMIGIAGIAHYLYSKDKKTFQNNWKDLEPDSGLKLK